MQGGQLWPGLTQSKPPGPFPTQQMPPASAAQAGGQPQLGPQDPGGGSQLPWGEPFCVQKVPEGQTVPQPPQLALSALTSTHPPSQHAYS